jgi:hypothetical protein
VIGPDMAQQRSSLVPDSRRSAPVGAENSVMSCDLQILVYQATEPVSS